MAAKDVVEFARKLVGSHYLWGAAGATPDGRDGAPHRPGSVRTEPFSYDPDKPSILAASCDVEGHYVCAGAYRKLPGGRRGNPRDVDLLAYLAAPTFMSNFVCDMPSSAAGSLSPRVVKGANVDDDGKIVWGGACKGVRHFDCVGFVNYVLSATTRVQYSGSIAQYPVEKITGMTTVDNKAPASDSDIVYRGTDHIGILTADGFVIQAEMAATGVHADEKYDPTKWTGRLRIPAFVHK